MGTAVRRLIFFASLLILWEAVYQLNTVYEFRSDALPSFLLTLQQLYVGFFETQILLDATVQSIYRIVVGFIIAVIVGTAIGIWLARSKIADETVGSLVIALQSIPSIVWLPLMLIIYGSVGTGPIITVVALAGAWVMISNMRMGIKSVDPLLLRASRTMGYQGSELVWKVMIPASIPTFLSATRLAWAFGWRALMAAELLGTGGLGRTLMDARDFYNFELVISIMIIIATIGLIMEYFVFNKIERRVFHRYGLESQG
ncbi:NitT/TauT family transport system permease protein [Salsuginibacillus halophilus]|uniref:NitT/TauT family transport system permease protein n=1 Tax=Salsuginibacillus halophilus TaxID=517424 RepID=A0A2P8HFZ0_9BACI|nr:ABC transporter permease [Salsuginibacillus halophilus]PSL45139.1 NitT/TauT family transport system permease protein [Salsuginibacillus halophilus]